MSLQTETNVHSNNLTQNQTNSDSNSKFLNQNDASNIEELLTSMVQSINDLRRELNEMRVELDKVKQQLANSVSHTNYHGEYVDSF